jgi:transposase
LRNRREIGGLVGLASVPCQSGDTSQDQGMCKTGNGRLRALTIEMVWSWLCFQPKSELTRWYQECFARGGRRLRKIGAVAVARKLLIALWRYLD